MLARSLILPFTFKAPLRSALNTVQSVGSVRGFPIVLYLLKTVGSFHKLTRASIITRNIPHKGVKVTLRAGDNLALS